MSPLLSIDLLMNFSLTLYLFQSLILRPCWIRALHPYPQHRRQTEGGREYQHLPLDPWKVHPRSSLQPEPSKVSLTTTLSIVFLLHFSVFHCLFLCFLTRISVVRLCLISVYNQNHPNYVSLQQFQLSFCPLFHFSVFHCFCLFI